jgi:hypothetical protein
MSKLKFKKLIKLKRIFKIENRNNGNNLMD